MNKCTISNDAQCKLIEGIADIHIYGGIDTYSLHIDGEEEGFYSTYTEALERAITMINWLM